MNILADIRDDIEWIIIHKPRLSYVIADLITGHKLGNALNQIDRSMRDINSNVNYLLQEFREESYSLMSFELDWIKSSLDDANDAMKDLAYKPRRDE